MSDSGRLNGTLSDQVTMEPQQTKLRYVVERNVMSQEEFAHASGFKRRKPSVLDNIRSGAKDFKCGKLVKETIPVLEWLPKYSCRKNLIGDIMAGITVAVMHIPQGMAYGLLAGLTPSVGLYMAFFPTLVYFLFGTSRHISTGTFAVISIMVSKIVNTYATLNPVSAPDSDQIMNATVASRLSLSDSPPIYTPFEVATAVTLAVGIFQILMYFMRLGTLASLFSTPLVSAFTTAAAVHVLVTQMKDLFGVDVPRHKGAFKIIINVINVGKQLPNLNPVTVIISASVMAFMIIMNEVVKPQLSKLCRFPVPSELIAVVGANLISMAVGLGPNYNVKLIGTIPVGLPDPQVPSFELLKLVAVDSIAVTVVSIAIGISMAFTFAQKQCYDVYPNQELLAFGISNVVGSFFSCIPLAASLSRSAIQEQTGGKTQVASVVSAGLILVLLLWVGPFFETLPRCVLGAVIIVALKSMFWQVKDIRKFASQSTLDVQVWIVTFLGVVLVDIDIGLLVGVIISLGALYIKGLKSYSHVLGKLDNTDFYVELSTHQNAREIPKLKIFRYVGAINFASKGSFKRELQQASKVDQKLIRRASSLLDKRESTKLFGLRAIVLDMSGVPHLDFSGCETLTELQNEFSLLGASFYLASPRDNVYDSLLHAQHLGQGPFEVLPTVHDAVLYHNYPYEVITS